MATLLGRTMTRARGVVAMMSISHMQRVEARLDACLWYLADRFGRVTAEGVVLPLPLTHMAPGPLGGGERAAGSHGLGGVGGRGRWVPTALGERAERGRVRRLPDGAYLLVGEPPAGEPPAMRPRQ